MIPVLVGCKKENFKKSAEIIIDKTEGLYIDAGQSEVTIINNKLITVLYYKQIFIFFRNETNYDIELNYLNKKRIIPANGSLTMPLQ